MESKVNLESNTITLIPTALSEKNEPYILVGVKKDSYYFISEELDSQYQHERLQKLAKISSQQSNQILGSEEFIYEVLQDPNAQSQIRPGSFLTFLGFLSQNRIKYLLKLFKKKQKTLTCFNNFDEISFIQFQDLVSLRTQNNNNKKLDKSILNNFPLNYEAIPEYKLLNQKKVPLKGQNIDYFSIWEQGLWVKKDLKNLEYVKQSLYRIPKKNEIDFNNQKSGKNYASGVIVSCLDKMKNPYLLLGQEKSGFCYFQGWQDKGDYNQEYTAAREGSEESNGVIGNQDFLLEILHDENQTEEIYQGCFIICLGQLSFDEMTYIIDLFSKKRMTTLNPMKREHKCLRWVNLKDFKITLTSSYTENMVPLQFFDSREQKYYNDAEKPQYLRKFFQECFPGNWKKYNSLKKLEKGENPFPETEKLFQLWLQNKYVPKYQLLWKQNLQN